MPTKKPRVQTILEENQYKKLKYLCERDSRTESNMTKMIIEKYIKEYESIHGEIKVED